MIILKLRWNLPGKRARTHSHGSISSGRSALPRNTSCISSLHIYKSWPTDASWTARRRKRKTAGTNTASMRLHVPYHGIRLGCEAHSSYECCSPPDRACSTFSRSNGTKQTTRVLFLLEPSCRTARL